MDEEINELGIYYATSTVTVDECQCENPKDDCDGDCKQPPPLK